MLPDWNVILFCFKHVEWVLCLLTFQLIYKEAHSRGSSKMTHCKTDNTYALAYLYICQYVFRCICFSI